MPGQKKPQKSSDKRSTSKSGAKKVNRPGTFTKNDNRANRRGRPKKGETFSDIIREKAQLKDVRNSRGELLTRKEALVDKLFSKAIQEGDFPTAKYLIERTDPPIGSEPPGKEEQTAEQVWTAVIAMVRRATEGHPAVRAKIVKELEAASNAD
jgi:hypothetical protein